MLIRSAHLLFAAVGKRKASIVTKVETIAGEWWERDLVEIHTCHEADLRNGNTSQDSDSDPITIQNSADVCISAISYSSHVLSVSARHGNFADPPWCHLCIDD